MSVAEVLERQGGVATRGELLRRCGRVDVDRAIAAGDVVAVARGRYAMPGADSALVAAHRTGGVVSHQSAALRHGWAVLHPPKRPHVMVPRHRRLSPEQRSGLVVHWADLAPGEMTDGVASPARTLADCLRVLPPLDALAVADSALRAGFSRDALLAEAAGARGPGSRQVREVASAASGLAANPFESGLRGIAHRVSGLSVRPQVPVYDPRFLGRADLVDERLRMILEADSFEWHGGRDALARDARRYNAFVASGWLVLRFSWEDVMFHEGEVEAVLTAAVQLRTEQLCLTCRAA